MTARLEILGDDGEWHELPDVTNVELHEVEPEHDPVPDRDTSVTTARPRVIDQDGRPVRPAWQSPYGPPPRRH
ncbi:hypothetical protein ACFYQA_08420 [Streptomyces sp. NPDC005774]|uniref:hypothetical protein n=1 Tax=Streptomyces sp. NPDC005774 TaxID=3364728 RepID=UPI00369BDE78